MQPRAHTLCAPEQLQPIANTVKIGVLICMFQNSTLPGVLQWHRFPWQPWYLTMVSKESQCSFSPEIDFQYGNLLYTSYSGSISIEPLVLYLGYHGNHCSTQGAILEHANEHPNFNSEQEASSNTNRMVVTTTEWLL